MLKKFLLAAVALFFIFVGSMILVIGYAVYNPNSIFTAFDRVTKHFTRGEAYKENEEFFLQGIQNVHVRTNHLKLQVRVYNGNTLKVGLEGKIPRFEQGPFIAQQPTQNEVSIELHEPIASQWIHMNINGREVTEESNSQLVGTLYIPNSYKGHFKIETQDGPVEMTVDKEQIFEFDLKSVNGKIENTAVMNPAAAANINEVAKIQILTTSGNITIKN
ncbi:MAG: DUF4097 family beta strand repeat protein [Bdellovibrio sp.]|nr:DUF4097 family beta strand repeat protein [Bdellovibrio sp.]